uniref:Protein asunder n=1 Tax=Steinernema glaseri TaxID=37863 RepID=A0A1I7Z6N4_9BILA
MLFSKNAIITIYHRTQANRTMKIQVDTSGAVAAAQKDASGQWTVPCDMIGYNGASKGRVPKVRFNPSTLEAPDATLEKAINEALQLLINQFIGAEWSVDVLYSAEDVRELQQVLMSQTGEVMFYDRTIVINWVLDAAVTPLMRRCSCLLSAATICVSPVENGGQHVRLDTASQEAWLEMQFALTAGFTPISSDSSAGHRLSTIISDKDSDAAVVRLTLQLSSDDTVAVVRERHGSKQVRPLPNCVSGDIYSSMALDSIQLRISRLRMALDDSITQLQVSKKAAGNGGARPCEIVYQNSTKGCFIHISGSTPISPEHLEPVKPLFEESVPELFNIAPRPLTVNIGSPTSPVPEPKLSSPSGSMDSGISSPGELSPLESPKFSEYVPTPNSRFRVRSVSECEPLSMDSDDSMNSSSTGDVFDEKYQVNGLKGILKRRGRAPKLGQISRRTVSECIPSLRNSCDDLSCMPLMQSLMMSFDEDEDNENYLSSLDELEETSDDLDPDAPVYTARRERKKSVSFSEHVQKRCFRADSSILAQKKRNEKKNRCRNRRSSDTIAEDCVGISQMNSIDRQVAMAH